MSTKPELASLTPNFMMDRPEVLVRQLGNSEAPFGRWCFLVETVINPLYQWEKPLSLN